MFQSFILFENLYSILFDSIGYCFNLFYFILLDLNYNYSKEKSIDFLL